MATAALLWAHATTWFWGKGMISTPVDIRNTRVVLMISVAGVASEVTRPSVFTFAGNIASCYCNQTQRKYEYYKFHNSHVSLCCNSGVDWLGRMRNSNKQLIIEFTNVDYIMASRRPGRSYISGAEIGA